MPLSLRYTSVVSLFGLPFAHNSCRNYLGRSIEKTDALLYQLKECDIKVVCADGTELYTFLGIFNSLLQHYHMFFLASL